VFQLAVGAHSSHADSLSVANPTDGEPSLVSNRSQHATSAIAANDEQPDVSIQEQCGDMSKRFPADVLVAMTMEELQYLESALCPSSVGADPPIASQ
jgi:hypothetical protein